MKFVGLKFCQVLLTCCNGARENSTNLIAVRRKDLVPLPPLTPAIEKKVIRIDRTRARRLASNWLAVLAIGWRPE